MEKHLCAFARDLIKREGGPVATSTIVHVFTNVGNPMPGDSAEDNRRIARDVLGDDDGLAHDAEADTWAVKT